MLKVTITSYDEQFDTFACVFTEDNGPTFESLLPASVLPYVAPALCDAAEDLPYDLIGQSFTMNRPESAA